MGNLKPLFTGQQLGSNNFNSIVDLLSGIDVSTDVFTMNESGQDVLTQTKGEFKGSTWTFKRNERGEISEMVSWIRRDTSMLKMTSQNSLVYTTDCVHNGLVTSDYIVFRGSMMVDKSLYTIDSSGTITFASPQSETLFLHQFGYLEKRITTIKRNHVGVIIEISQKEEV